MRAAGVGIAPDRQSRIFERFERGVEQRSGGFAIGSGSSRSSASRWAARSPWRAYWLTAQALRFCCQAKRHAPIRCRRMDRRLSSRSQRIRIERRSEDGADPNTKICSGHRGQRSHEPSISSLSGSDVVRTLDRGPSLAPRVAAAMAAMGTSDVDRRTADRWPPDRCRRTACNRNPTSRSKPRTVRSRSAVAIAELLAVVQHE